MTKPKRCKVCGRPEHGPGNNIPEDEYEAHGLLRVVPAMPDDTDWKAEIDAMLRDEPVAAPRDK